MEQNDGSEVRGCMLLADVAIRYEAQRRFIPSRLTVADERLPKCQKQVKEGRRLGCWSGAAKSIVDRVLFHPGRHRHAPYLWCINTSTCAEDSARISWKSLAPFHSHTIE